MTELAARMARDLTRLLDKPAFAVDCGLTPQAWQAEVMESRDRRMLLNCARGAGKSTVTALLALHDALYSDSTTVLIGAPSQQHSVEMLRKVVEFWRALDGVPRSITENQRSLELENRSRVIALSGNPRGARGFHGVSLAIIDEAAQIDDELIEAITPTVGRVRGRVIALSTPKGRRGWFYQTWTSGTDWKRVSVTAEQCSMIPADELEMNRRDWPEWKFRQEYCCEFHDDDTQLFASELIQAAMTPGIETVF